MGEWVLLGISGAETSRSIDAHGRKCGSCGICGSDDGRFGGWSEGELAHGGIRIVWLDV